MWCGCSECCGVTDAHLLSALNTVVNTGRAVVAAARERLEWRCHLDDTSNGIVTFPRSARGHVTRTRRDLSSFSLLLSPGIPLEHDQTAARSYVHTCVHAYTHVGVCAHYTRITYRVYIGSCVRMNVTGARNSRVLPAKSAYRRTRIPRVLRNPSGVTRIFFRRTSPPRRALKPHGCCALLRGAAHLFGDE